MKIVIRTLIFLSAGLLTACSIGNGRICGPQTPKVNCDKEALEKLLHPKPYLHKWNKEGVSPEMRRDDAFNCGGRRSDTHPMSRNNEEALQLSGETIWDANKRLVNLWRQCMLNKDYIYIGKCYDTEYGRDDPSCKGRVLEPLQQK